MLMSKNIFAFLVLLLVILFAINFRQESQISGAPPYGASEEEVPQSGPYSLLANWTRPEGPAKVGIQIGHYKNDELPDELERLRGNTGAQGGGKWEWEVNYEIAHLIAKDLEAQGVAVDILPATIPPSYWADVFIAIHADGSEDRTKSGYKFAGPWRDFSGGSSKLVTILEKKYEEATGLSKDENISRNMRGYYAFSWWRNEHAVHPMTTAVIAETGFLTNRNDQRLLINSPKIPASAIAEGIFEYLRTKELI